MGVWNRTFFVLCLASVEAQAQVPVRGVEQPVQCIPDGYDRNSQFDDARLLISFALGFFCMHCARKRLRKQQEDPDGFGNFDFLEDDDTPLCQMAILKLGL